MGKLRCVELVKKWFEEVDRGNVWLYGSDGEIYVRKTNRYIENKKMEVLDIANVAFYKPGQGTFTKLLEELKHIPVIYIENVLSERLIKFLEKKGFKEDFERCYYKIN